MRQSAQFVVCMCQQGLLYSSEGMLHFGQPVGMVVSVVVSLGQGRRVLCRMRVCAVRRPVGEAVGGLRRVISSAKVAAHFTDQVSPHRVIICLVQACVLSGHIDDASRFLAAAVVSDRCGEIRVVESGSGTEAVIVVKVDKL